MNFVDFVCGFVNSAGLNGFEAFSMVKLCFASESNEPVTVDRSRKNGDVGPSCGLWIVHFNSSIYVFVSMQSTF